LGVDILHTFNIEIGDETFTVDDLTPFVLIIRRLFYEDDSQMMLLNVSNLKEIHDELKKVMKMEEKLGEKIPSYSYMPISYLELMEYMDENGVSIEDFADASSNGIVRIAENLADSNEYDEALKFIELALKLIPDDPYPLMLKGSFLVEMGRMDEGVEYLEKSVEKDPSLVTAYSILGDIYYNKGDYERASSYWEREIEISPESRFTYFMIADAKKKMGDLRGAIEILEKLAKMDKNDILVRYELMELYNSIGNEEMAKKYEMEILDSKPCYSNDLEVWAKVQYKHGNYDVVREILESGEFNMDDPMIKLLLIVPYAKCGKLDRARELLEELKMTSSWYFYGKKEFLSEFLKGSEIEEIMRE